VFCSVLLQHIKCDVFYKSNCWILTIIKPIDKQTTTFKLDLTNVLGEHMMLGNVSNKITENEKYGTLIWG